MLTEDNDEEECPNSASTSCSRRKRAAPAENKVRAIVRKYTKTHGAAASKAKAKETAKSAPSARAVPNFVSSRARLSRHRVRFAPSRRFCASADAVRSSETRIVSALSLSSPLAHVIAVCLLLPRSSPIRNPLSAVAHLLSLFCTTALARLTAMSAICARCSRSNTSLSCP